MKIGPYEVHEVLSRGSEGVTYEALDPTRRGVVLRILAHLENRPQLLEAFTRDIHRVLRLNHPNIEPILDAGVEAGRPFVVTRPSDEADLKKIIAAGERISVEARLRILLQACNALAYAHQRFVVHGNLSPGSVRVTSEGTVKIADFGFAPPTLRAGDRGLDLVTPKPFGQLVLETLAPDKLLYASPERIRGDLLDHRTDIYSLGAIAFELVSGVRPFGGRSHEAVVWNICEGRIQSEAFPNTDYSPGLDSVVLKAMACSPNDRFDVTDTMSRLLEQLLKDEPLVWPHLEDPGKIVSRHFASQRGKTPGWRISAAPPASDLDSSESERDDAADEGLATHGSADRRRTQADMETEEAVNPLSPEPAERPQASRLVIAGGSMAGAAFLGASLFGPVGAISFGLAALLLGLRLKND